MMPYTTRSMKKKNTRVVSVVLTVFISLVMLSAGFVVPQAANTVLASTVISNLVVTPGADGSSATITGKITTGGYDYGKLAVEYSAGSIIGQVPVSVTDSNADNTDSFNATLTGLTPGTYTYGFLDDVSTWPNQGTFKIAAGATTATVAGVSATPSADGTSVTITGSITSGAYDVNSLVVAYGTTSSLSSVAAATATAGTNGTDTFTATLSNIPAGSYSFGVGDADNFTFPGSTGTFTLTGTATGNTGTNANGNNGSSSNGSSNTGGASSTTSSNTGGAASTSSGIGFNIPNPLTGVSTIPDFLAKIINAFLLVLTPIVVIMFIYSGFLFVQAQGNEEKIQTAKRTLLYTIIGAAVILGSKGIALAVQQTVTQF